MLQRSGAEAEYAPAVVARGQDWFRRSSERDRDQLLASIMAGLPEVGQDDLEKGIAS